MSYPINYPTPQGANVQIFTANSSTTTASFASTWVKPQGAVMVWFTLIGAGGAGGDADSDGVISGFGGGGGSGAVTNCMIPAFLIPDILKIRVCAGATTNAEPTDVYYQQKDGTGYLLLEAKNGSNGGLGNSDTGTGGVGGAASVPNAFSAAGFYQSTAGQAGSAGNVNLTTSTTTFLQGGTGGGASGAPSQYGYERRSGASNNQYGYAMMSPILVSVGSTQTGAVFTSNNESEITKNGFGSGGGGASIESGTVRKYGGRGGDGLCVIVTW